MRFAFITYFIYFLCESSVAQTLPLSRSVDWTLAGLRDTSTTGLVHLNMQSFGAVGDGITPNDSFLLNAINSVGSSGAIIEFATGDFLFNSVIILTKNIIIRGQGANNTTFMMDLGGTGHSIIAQGFSNNQDTSLITQSAIKDSSYIIIQDSAFFSNGDWIQIIMDDSDLITSYWALNTVGQIVQIDSILNDTIILASPLRMTIDTMRSPYIRKIIPVKNVGIECLKVERLDDTAPEKTSNIHFSYAVNCWVSGIESNNCTFSHVDAEYSSNISVEKSYFHHAFNYGGDGRAYGVVLHFTSNECLVENNVFEHLRHSVLLQVGVNGNVIAYNYSFDPFWNSLPNDAAGDMVLHGNYPFANLFEQNICQNITIDDSHGPNGPYNTFFRNKAEKYGIFFSASNSPNQNLLGNEITNTSFPYSLVNYTISGTGHFIHGNNNKGSIDPPGTQVLPDSSYAYSNRPSFIPVMQWAAIGTPNIFNAASIPAQDRYNAGNIFSNACGNVTIGIEDITVTDLQALVFPNPSGNFITLQFERTFDGMIIINDILGREIWRKNYHGTNVTIDLKILNAKGTYVLKLTDNYLNSIAYKKIIYF